MTDRRRSQQFIGMLESLRMPAQFQRGRRLARSGQVRQLSISSSLVIALVVDADGDTHRARIAVRAFGAADWHRIEGALAERAVYAARLLAGEVPDEIDDLLAGFGLSLFPESLADVALDCSCPSWQVPCEHLAAACYALADSFDRDPFGLLAWRGRGRDDLLTRLRALRHAPEPATPIATARTPLAGFWSAGPRVAPPAHGVAGGVRRPDALLEQLDPLDLTAGRYDVVELLRAAYRAIADTGAREDGAGAGS